MASYKERIVVGYNEADLVGRNVDEVELLLEDIGFTYVLPRPLDDLSMKEMEKEDTVASVKFENVESFDEKSKFPYDTKIVVAYHTSKIVRSPITNKDARRENYKDIVALFKEAGFENIKTSKEHDLTKMFGENKINTVKRVLIDGEKDFEENQQYRVDCEVEIIYHTYRSDK